MISRRPGQREPGCPGFRWPQPVQGFRQTPRPSSSSGASRRTTSARIESPSAGHLAVRSGLEPNAVNQSILYLYYYPKATRTSSGSPMNRREVLPCVAMPHTGADRATKRSAAPCFLSQNSSCDVGETRGSRSRLSKPKDTRRKGPPKGSGPQRR